MLMGCPILPGVLGSRRPRRRLYGGSPPRSGMCLHYPVVIVAALALVLVACQPAGRTALAGRVMSVPVPVDSRLTVQVCEQAAADCGRWLYPDAAGRFEVDDLEPSDYRITVFLEEPNGLTPLVAVQATVSAGRTTNVELAVRAIPSMPST